MRAAGARYRASRNIIIHRRRLRVLALTTAIAAAAAAISVVLSMTSYLTASPPLPSSPTDHRYEQVAARLSTTWHARNFNRINHHRVTGVSLRPPRHWRRPCGRPRASWQRTTDTDVQSVNIGSHSAWRKASDRTLWRRIVDTATLHNGARHARFRRYKCILVGDTDTWV